MKLRINVTQKDIDNGLPRHFEVCPVTLAMKRNKTLRNREPQTGAFNLMYRMDDGHTAFTPHPPVVADFVDRLDHGHPVKPFRFTFDAKGVAA